jgi:hypothetical protein
MITTLRNRLLCVISLCALFSCSDPVAPVDSGRGYAFSDGGRLTLAVTPDTVATDLPVTITTRCVPRVTGRGRLILAGYSDNAAAQFYLESPIHDTIVRLADSTVFDRVEIPFSFTADTPCIQDWVVRFSERAGYRVWSMAIIDSVYVPDSLRMFPVSSETARRSQGIAEGAKWVIYAGSEEHSFQP